MTKILHEQELFKIHVFRCYSFYGHIIFKCYTSRCYTLNSSVLLTALTFIRCTYAFSYYP